MGDAEIIPIGTRGRPGRGTGTQPSSAARGLAPKAGQKAGSKAGPKAPAKKPPQEAAPPPPEVDDTPVIETPQPHAAAPATTNERHPMAGIPSADWLAA
ncbi:MAG: hypothetical protein Q7J48_09220, partial [Nocardioides sp.]|nr:hypothetical protein [Nocardioides sp.]